METLTQSSFGRATWIALAVALLAAAGCSWRPWRLASDPPVDDCARDPLHEAGRADERPTDETTARWGLLAETTAAWVRLPQPSESIADDPGNRWRFPRLEKAIAERGKQAADFHAALKEKDRFVAANAAIALARLEDGAGRDQLVAAVGDSKLPLSTRCAAAEALGSLRNPSPVDSLRKLVDSMASKLPVHSSEYAPEVHAELIRSLARHVDPASDPRFTKALHSPDPGVKVEALRVWARGRSGSLPSDVVELVKSNEPRVRIAAVQTIAKRRPPKAEEHLQAAIEDQDLRVRFAAIAALAEIGGAGAQTRLERLMADRGEMVRAAALAGLAKLGAEQAVLKGKDDKSDRVRLVVAEALEQYPDAAGAAVARELLDDRSSAVQLRVLTSVRQWPKAQSAPILWEAMAKSAYLTRQTAARQLVSTWPAAADFPVDGPAAQRAEFLERHQAGFRREFGEIEVAASSETPVIPNPGPIFATLDQFDTKDLPTRRQAIEQLANLAKDRPLGTAAMTRLASLVEREPDALVWRSVFILAAADGSEPSIRLGYIALGHPSPEVRREACEHLGAHPSPAHAEALVRLLDDPQPTVVASAVRALGTCGRLENVEPLKKLLAHPNEALRVDVATALAMVGDPSGVAALERSSYSNDATVRRQAAMAMGRVGDPTFTPALIRLLDDQHSIRLAALDSLPKVTGRAPPPASSQSVADRIDYWKHQSETAQNQETRVR